MAKYVGEKSEEMFHLKYPGFKRIPVGEDFFLLWADEVDDFIEGNTEFYEIPACNPPRG